jgi:hypothetical protein
MDFLSAIVLAIGGFFFGVWLGQVVERAISFPAIKREMSNKIDQIDGKIGNS